MTSIDRRPDSRPESSKYQFRLSRIQQLCVIFSFFSFYFIVSHVSPSHNDIKIQNKNLWSFVVFFFFSCLSFLEKINIIILMNFFPSYVVRKKSSILVSYFWTVWWCHIKRFSRLLPPPWQSVSYVSNNIRFMVPRCFADINQFFTSSSTLFDEIYYYKSLLLYILNWKFVLFFSRELFRRSLKWTFCCQRTLHEFRWMGNSAYFLVV